MTQTFRGKRILLPFTLRLEYPAHSSGIAWTTICWQSGGRRWWKLFESALLIWLLFFARLFFSTMNEVFSGTWMTTRLLFSFIFTPVVLPDLPRGGARRSVPIRDRAGGAAQVGKPGWGGLGLPWAYPGQPIRASPNLKGESPAIKWHYSLIVWILYMQF